MKTDWQTKKLGELCDIKTGKKDVNQGNPTGMYPFFTCARDHTYSDEYSFDTEALLVAGNGDVGHVSYYKGKFEAYQRTYVISDFRGISPRLLFLFLDGFLKDTVSKQKLGNTMPYIKMGMLTEFEVPVPPLVEQKVIVKKLDDVFEKVTQAKENAENNLQNSKNIFNSYLAGVFRTVSMKSGVKKLGDACESVEYGTSAKSKKTGKVAVLRMGNIQNGRIDWSSLVYTDDKDEIKKYLLKNNDVLFNRTNSPELVGKTAIYKGEMPAIFAGYLIRIHRNEKMLGADYLNYFLNSNLAKEQGNKVVISSVNQANINGQKLKNYLLPLPSLAEQKTIVKKLDALSVETKKLEKVYEQKLADLEELKKSVLSKAFNAEL